VNLFRTEGWKLKDGAEMAFRKDADGRGYIQEMKLPWPLITKGRRYSAGESFRCGVELLWGEADWPVHRYADNLADGATSREFFWTAKDAWGEVRLEPKGGLTLPVPPWEKEIAEERPEGPVEIRYEIPRDARVTIAIDDMEGRRVRNLLPAAERKAGANTDLWDGLDDSGNVVPPGEYRVKGLHHDGLRLKYATSFASPGDPPWNTADGKGAFYGDHTAPQAVAAGGDMLALACPMGEAGPHLIGVDLEGRRQWALKNRRSFGGGRISLATDGRTLWIANADGKDGAFTIWRCELKTGKYAPWKRKGDKGDPVLDLPLGGDAMAELRCIALHDGALAVIKSKSRRLLVLDAETGDVTKELADMPEGMSACAFGPAGELYLAAGEKLYRVDLASGRRRVVRRGLDAPSGVACDSKGNVYVAQRGSRQCVLVVSPRGREVRTVGKRGGRPRHGFFDEKGMLQPRQIAVDSRDRLWVTEETHHPKRTSVWSLEGELLFDLAGPTGYAAGGVVNPLDHARGWSEGVEYSLDHETGRFRPLYTLSSPVLGEGRGFGAECKITRVEGREYLQTTGRQRSSGWVWIFVRDPDGSWRNVAAFGRVGQGRSIDEPGHKHYNAQFRTPLWEGLFGKSFVWTDANDDRKAERAELDIKDIRLGRFYWGQMVGDDLTVAIPYGQREIMVFRPQGFTDRGVPRYSFDSAETVVREGPVGGEGMMAVGRDGRLYLNQSPLTAVDRSGKVLWTYPSDYVSVHGSHRAPAARPGLLIGPSSFYGTAFVNDEVGEVLYLNGNLGQNFIFTEDGLWVQSLYNDCRGWFDVPARAVRGMSCDAMTAGGESFGGDFCRSDDGRYYTTGGGTAAIVMEVTGLDTLRRFSGSVRVTDADVRAAQELKVARAARKQAKKVYTVTRAAEPPPTDGSLEGWGMEKDALELQAGRHKVGTVKAMYDDAILYLAYKVNDRSPLKNAGQDEKLMFVTGDCVDLMLRTDANSEKASPVAGDLRLLMTVRAGKPLAVVYRPVAPGAPAGERAEFSSPWRTIPFDSVKVVEFPLAMKPVRGGYAVTAAVPLELLGLRSLKGVALRGDFGILRSDQTGRECTSRNYWSNKTTNNTNDVPDEAILAPGLWGEIRFE
jgi:hypothetical protein